MHAEGICANGHKSFFIKSPALSIEILCNILARTMSRQRIKDSMQALGQAENHSHPIDSCLCGRKDGSVKTVCTCRSLEKRYQHPAPQTHHLIPTKTSSILHRNIPEIIYKTIPSNLYRGEIAHSALHHRTKPFLRKGTTPIIDEHPSML